MSIQELDVTRLVIQREIDERLATKVAEMRQSLSSSLGLGIKIVGSAIVVATAALTFLGIRTLDDINTRVDITATKAAQDYLSTKAPGIYTSETRRLYARALIDAYLIDARRARVSGSDLGPLMPLDIKAITDVLKDDQTDDQTLGGALLLLSSAAGDIDRLTQRDVVVPILLDLALAKPPFERLAHRFETRTSALRALVAFWSGDAAPAVQGLARDEELPVALRAAAVRFLGDSRSQKAIPLVVSLVSSPEVDLSSAALESLAELEPSHEALQSWLQRLDPRTVEPAAAARAMSVASKATNSCRTSDFGKKPESLEHSPLPIEIWGRLAAAGLRLKAERPWTDSASLRLSLQRRRFSDEESIPELHVFGAEVSGCYELGLKRLAVAGNLAAFSQLVIAFEVTGERGTASLLNAHLYGPGAGLRLRSGLVVTEGLSKGPLLLYANRPSEPVLVRWWNGAQWQSGGLAGFQAPEGLGFTYGPEEFVRKLTEQFN